MTWRDHPHHPRSRFAAALIATAAFALGSSACAAPPRRVAPRPPAPTPTSGTALDDPARVATRDGLITLVAGRDPIGLGACIGDDPDRAARAATRQSTLISESAHQNTQIAAVVSWVAAARGEPFVAVPRVVALTRSAYRARTAQLARAAVDAGTARLDEEVLAALGAVAPGTDLVYGAVELAQARLLADAEPASNTVFVSADDVDRPLAPDSLIALAGALVRLLAAQHGHGLPARAPSLVVDDGARAARTAADGPTTLLMSRFALEAIEPDAASAASGPVPSPLPHYLARAALFGATAGLERLCTLGHGRPGRAAIDALELDPPRSTAAALGFAAAGGTAPMAGDPGPGWRLVRQGTFGAAALVGLFEAPGDNESVALDHATERAGAWAGGTVHQWHDASGAAAVALVLMSRSDASVPLCSSIRLWSRRAAPRIAAAGGRVVVECPGRAVRVAVARDARVARALAAA